MTRSKVVTGSRRKFERSLPFALAAAGLSAPKITRAAGALIHPATGWAAYPAACVMGHKWPLPISTLRAV